jgi:hypothetical protein
MQTNLTDLILFTHIMVEYYTSIVLPLSKFFTKLTQSKKFNCEVLFWDIMPLDIDTRHYTHRN